MIDDDSCDAHDHSVEDEREAEVFMQPSSFLEDSAEHGICMKWLFGFIFRIIVCKSILHIGKLVRRKGVMEVD